MRFAGHSRCAVRVLLPIATFVGASLAYVPVAVAGVGTITEFAVSTARSSPFEKGSDG